ncbi:MAG: GIY-YIG nuclease family protein [Candidatus Staskawiczbacteria bacterium]|nr:GIY-YIG nuclease family protein [Candidatus Staskawiczbacteria bacterium]
MYYVYFLLLNTGEIYKGFTSELERRIQEHKLGNVISTKNKQPKLICYEAYLLKSDAARREKFLKTTEGRRLLRQQLRDVLIKFQDSSSGHTT